MKDIRFKFVKWHLYLLGLVLINLGTDLITGYSLNQNLTFFLKIILYLTGLFLFFKTLRPFRLTTVYFSFYPISVIVISLFFLFGGIFLSIISSVLLYPITPNQTKYKTETIKINDRFQGFMGRCCSYEVIEPKLYIFEKHLGYIHIEKPINADEDEFSLKNNTIIYTYRLDNYEHYKQTTKLRDTTEILKFE